MPSFALDERHDAFRCCRCADFRHADTPLIRRQAPMILRHAAALLISITIISPVCRRWEALRHTLIALYADDIMRALLLCYAPRRFFFLALALPPLFQMRRHWFRRRMCHDASDGASAMLAPARCAEAPAYAGEAADAAALLLLLPRQLMLLAAHSDDDRRKDAMLRKAAPSRRH